MIRPWPAKTATPQFRLADLDGKQWDLANLRGKVVVLNFWASWCGPCVDELPVLNALAEARQDQLVVLGVNYKEGRFAIERFAGQHPFRYPVLMDKSGDYFKKWTNGVMPTTVLIDRQGRARWRVIGEIGASDQRFEQTLEQLLAEKSK